MIVIERNTKTKLATRFHYANNICAYIYDQFTEILDREDYEKMSNTSIDFNNDSVIKELFEKNELHAFDILAKHNRTEELEVIVTKHVVMSILADMVNFIYESIIIAQKGKMSVAYSLLRKPFKDQLCILEQILIDRKDFIARFFHDGNPNAYDPSSPHIDNREIINKVMSKLNLIAMDTDFVYDLRYNKSVEWGLSAMSDKAIHIVTSNKNYKTPNQDFNFAFVTPEEVEDLCEHYYFILPQLLLYVASVIDAIVFDLIPSNNRLRNEKRFKRFIAAIMLMDHKDGVDSKPLYKLMSTNLKTPCNICGNINKFTKVKFIEYFFEHSFYCKRCSNPVELNEESMTFLEEFFNRTRRDDID